MKAFVVDRYGSNEHVRLAERPEPEVREDDVLIRVEAAGVNPLDVRTRAGKLKPILPFRTPFPIGNDLAGTVVRVGARVRRFKPGDAVYALPDKLRIGAFAELIAVREDEVAAKPASLSMAEAASVPMVGLTAWQVLVERAAVKPGQKVLIHAGSGGVGSFAIQLAKHLGATVATTAGTANLDWVKSLGADIVIDYRREDFSTRLRDYDLVFDTVGGAALWKSLAVLRPGGKLVSISGPPDPGFAKQLGASWVLGQAMRLLSWRIRRAAKRRGVSYEFLFVRPSGDQLRQLGALIDAGAIRPVVERVFPFAATRDALAQVEAGRTRGKIVIAVAD